MTTEPEPESEEVLAWCRNLVRIMKDGGVWGIPRSGVTFKFDKKAQRLILQIGSPDHPDFLATKRVFGQIGWEVVDKEPPHGRPDAAGNGSEAR